MANQQRSLEKGTFNDYLPEGEYTFICGNTEQLSRISYKFFDSLPKIECVYSIFNNISKKYYIGSTKNLSDRIKRHYYYLRKNEHHSKKLQNSFNKYGQFAFQINIKSFDSSEELEYIKYYDSFNNGYNCTENTFKLSNFNLTEEQINKAIFKRCKKIVALDLEGNYLNTYESLSDAARKNNITSSNLSKCLKGKIRYLKNQLWLYFDEYDSTIEYKLRKFKRTKEHNLKISNSNKGKTKTKEHVEKIARSQGTNVGKYDINNILIEEYYSIKDAGRKNNIHFSTISRKIKNKTPFGEYYFKIIENIV